MTTTRTLVSFFPIATFGLSVVRHAIGLIGFYRPLRLLMVRDGHNLSSEVPLMPVVANLYE
ncbi:hypothetical protein NET03_09130 [Thermomicrobium sp. CFH 73360]|uniref:hypothetical protein n=1 Tax=Thermomicrobium sp. CFH 73360 TaxID=2951987 RepID=UPI0020771A51|nr:hypothetical protein [Thermomicrobium sp. CFH 73360]MCM8746690.1 hypothetical protein [Thermomicrobium sp. CFH 73360]